MAPPSDQPPPDGGELYTIGEVARKLRMEVRTLRRLIEEGEFPRPQAPSRGIQVWSDEDVLYYRLRMQLRPRLRPARKPKPPPKGPKS